jgi:hypothetical protein
LSLVGDLKIQELSMSGALAKKIYLYDKKLIIGTEKNNSGGELFVISLDQNNIPQTIVKSIKVGGQVSSIYEKNNLIYVANAADIELLVYDKDFRPVSSYDAPLSLGNGKSVLYLEPYIYLGRTVASFELFFLELKNEILNNEIGNNIKTESENNSIIFIDKYKISSTVDFLQQVSQYILVMSNTTNKELQFYSKDRVLKKTLALPSRVSSYDCFNNTFLFANIINNKSHILWVK